MLAQKPETIQRRQPIADARFGAETAHVQARAGQLAADVRQMDTKVLGLMLGIGSPNLAQKLTVRHHFSRVAGQATEQSVFDRR